MGDRTMLHRLADALLGDAGPLSEFVDARRATDPPTAWYRISVELYKATGGRVDVTSATLQSWFPPELEVAGLMAGAGRSPSVRWLYHLRSADGTLLYIGCTRDVLARLRSHRYSKSWWPEVVEVEAEPLPWMEAWIREQHEIRVAPGRYNVTQGETARRGWETRRRRQQAAHAAGRRCGVSNCQSCYARSQKVSA